MPGLDPGTHITSSSFPGPYPKPGLTLSYLDPHPHLTLSYLDPGPHLPSGLPAFIFLLLSILQMPQCCPCLSPAHSPPVGPQHPWEKSQGPVSSAPHWQLHILLLPKNHIPLPSLKEPHYDVPGPLHKLFFLPGTASLGSLECSFSLFKISNITSLLSLCLIPPLPTQPGPSSGPLSLGFFRLQSLHSRPPHDPIPRGDPVSPSLARSPPMAPKHCQAESQPLRLVIRFDLSSVVQHW